MSDAPSCKICDIQAVLMDKFFKIVVLVSKFPIFLFVASQKNNMTRSFVSRMRVNLGDKKFRELHNCISLNCGTGCCILNFVLEYLMCFDGV